MITLQIILSLSLIVQIALGFKFGGVLSSFDIVCEILTVGMLTVYAFKSFYGWVSPTWVIMLMGFIVLIKAYFLIKNINKTLTL